MKEFCLYDTKYGFLFQYLLYSVGSNRYVSRFPAQGATLLDHYIQILFTVKNF